MKNDGLIVGTTVSHKGYGTGVIIKREQGKSGNIIMVKFSDDVGTRKLSVDVCQNRNLLRIIAKPNGHDDRPEFQPDGQSSEENPGQNKNRSECQTGEEKFAVIRAPASERFIVNAGPGTGKTYTLIEKIKYLISSGEADPRYILVLCFSKAAVQVIRTRLKEAADRKEISSEWRLVDVRTFDSFATYVLAWLQRESPSSLPAGYELSGQDYDQRILMATQVFNQRRSALMSEDTVAGEDILGNYQHVIVDEVQDLVGYRAELVLAILGALPEDCGFTLLGDSCQSIYDYVLKNDPGLMSSEEFYRTLEKRYSEAHFCTLSRNFRQTEDLEKLTEPYREAILSGDCERCSKVAASLYKNIRSSPISPQSLTNRYAKKYTESGTLGILTRSNAQALEISSWLRRLNVPHNLQRPAGNSDFDEWIYRVLSESESDVIDESEFISIWERLYPEAMEQADLYWQALISGDTESQRHKDVVKILQGLITDARDPLLYSHPGKSPEKITVSNIHRAKGMEFDSVIVIDDVIKAMADPDNDDMLENKVCYVALTRPKKRLEKANIGDQFIYVSKDDNRRCFKRDGKRSRYLSDFEIGCNGDIDFRTFASSIKSQDYISRKLKVGDRLVIKKTSKDMDDHYRYGIYPEKAENILLGYTTPYFSRCMGQAIRKIFCKESSRYLNPENYFKYSYDNIYVDGKTTCIAHTSDKIQGSIKIRDWQIWLGISVSGFAHLREFSQKG